MTPKRKVTDLLPSEAILISSDADMKVLDEFEKAGITWSNGEKATQWKHFPMSYCFLRYNEDGEEGLFWLHTKDCEEWGKTIYPATDFFPTESDEVEVSDTVLLSEVRNKLTPIKNLIALLESGFIAPSGSQELIYKELKQCKINIEELSRNTPNQ